MNQIAANIARVTAPNASVMTGGGTNTYIVGNQNLVIIDPGPKIDEHIDALVTAIDGRSVQGIVVTHTHFDHSPAAIELQKRVGGKLIGPISIDDGQQDLTFQPDQVIEHDDCINVDDQTIRAIHTPGHVGNHFCYLIEPQGMLVTGDHIMQGSTVVIIPPSGDMKDYLASLEKLKSYPVKALAPGHGELIENPFDEVQRLIDHRLTRESKVINVLKTQQTGSIATLTPQVYDDVDAKLHPIAQLSLWAHLLKLEKDGLAHKTSTNIDATQEQWAWIA